MLHLLFDLSKLWLRPLSQTTHFKSMDFTGTEAYEKVRMTVSPENK